MEKPINPHGSRGLKLADAPSAVETLEHLEQTLDNLDPVDPKLTQKFTDADKAAAQAVIDAAADAVIAEVTGVTNEIPLVPEGTLEAIGGENVIDPELDRGARDE